MFKKSVSKKPMFLFLLLATCFLILQPVFATEFSADYTTTEKNGKVHSGKAFIQNDKIRYEFQEKKDILIMIIRLDKKVSWTIMPKNQYMEIAFDPSSVKPTGDNSYTQEKIKTENVSGYDCDVIKYTYKDKSKGILYQWLAPKLGYPVKLESRDGSDTVKSTTIYVNIKEGKQADDLFELPAGAKSFNPLGGMKLFGN